jgi:DNA replication protein DnaC
MKRELLENLNCRKCKTEFKARYLTVLGINILVGDGYCPECAKKQYEAEQELERAKLQSVTAALRRRKRETCGIPPKFMTEDFSTFKSGWQDKAFKICYEYANNFPVSKKPLGYKSLYLWSKDSWGTGKTHLAASILHQVLNSWKGDGPCPNVCFVSEPELFRRLQETFSFTREEERIRESAADIIYRLTHVDLLVLDDVGKEPRRDMDFVRRTHFSVINGRYENKLPLIITANLDPGGLRNHIDQPPTEASYNRFMEMIDGKYVHMDGKSYRQVLQR